MIKKNKWALNNGFTLIELLLALVILGIISALVFSFLTYGNKSFRSGGNQSDIQSELRILADEVTEEIRYAENTQIYSTIPIFDNQYKYIYLDSTDHLIKFRIGNSAPITLAGTSGVVTITFSKESNRMIHFLLSEAKSSQTFKLESSVDLFNLGNNAIVGTSGSVLRFGPIGDDEVVAQDANELEIGITETSGNIVLPIIGSIGSTISWSVVGGTSPYLSISGSNGTVTRPPLGSVDIPVTIKATITKNAENLYKEFVILIKAQNLDLVTMDVAAGTLNNTSNLMYYQIGISGPWVQASNINTSVLFVPGTVTIRDSANTIQREIGIIPPIAPAPSVILSSKNDKNAYFIIDSRRAVATDDLQFTYDSLVWNNIGDSTDVDSKSHNTIIVRVKPTPVSLPSLETVNLDN